MSLLLIVLPVFIVFTVGYIGQKTLHFNIKTISTMTLYLMSPLLAFRTFYATPITVNYAYIFIFAILLCFFLWLITAIFLPLFSVSRSERSGVMLGTVFMNSGNYGAPVALFAFGAAGFHTAVMIMVIHSLFMNSLGIYIASIGSKQKYSSKVAIQKAIKMPVLHGAILGILLQLLHVPIHESIMNGIDLIADASIPVVMLVLGMQLATIVRKKVRWSLMYFTTFVRMIISPLLAATILYFIPLSNDIKAVLILQSAMPAAANTTMLALQFDTEPDLVSISTLVTTILSLISIPVVLYFLGV
ncbi:AEC family transporter [Kurthia senegalensis]|uniref:AEC family transporter n=1 Tax=Kurthia senegalensis TaxID=1033740 RepID=UPI000289849F|nr:AEC family transporter [Kurthia senegalensis]